MFNVELVAKKKTQLEINTIIECIGFAFTVSKSTGCNLVGFQLTYFVPFIMLNKQCKYLMIVIKHYVANKWINKYSGM